MNLHVPPEVAKQMQMKQMQRNQIHTMAFQIMLSMIASGKYVTCEDADIFNTALNTAKSFITYLGKDGKDETDK